MRTIEELTHDALTLRRGLLEQDKDPLVHCFHVSPEEYCLLKMQPMHGACVNHAEDRFCGLRLQELLPELRSQSSRECSGE